MREVQIGIYRRKLILGYVFVHGLGQNSSDWKETIDYLDRVTNIDCPDLFDLYKGELSYKRLYRIFKIM